MIADPEALRCLSTALFAIVSTVLAIHAVGPLILGHLSRLMRNRRR